MGLVRKLIKMGHFTHRRQFVIERRPIQLADGFRSYELFSGVFISICDKLPVRKFSSNEGHAVWLLGDVVYLDGDSSKLSLDISKSTEDDISHFLANLVGRWILIWNNTLYVDASALLGVFYTQTKFGLCVTSSASYLIDEFGLEKVKGRPTITGASIMPSSGIINCAKLLPSQCLKLGTGEVSGIPAISSFQDSPEAAIRSATVCIGRAFQELSSQYNKIYLGLSGGHDSRILLGIAGSYGIKPECVTFVKINTLAGKRGAPRASFAGRSDKVIPDRLARIADVNHRYVEPDDFKPNLLSDYDRHVGGMFSDNERYYSAYGHSAKVIGRPFVKGHVLELARGQYSFQFRKLRIKDLATQRTSEGLGLDQLDCDSEIKRNLIEWIDWIRVSQIYPSDWALADVFYIEQRMGGWLSNVYQGSDFGYDAFPICNCRRLIYLLLSIPLETRQAGVFYESVMSECSPQLLREPVNPVPGIVEVACRHIYKIRDKGIGWALRRGFKKTRIGKDFR